jgi:hypothetical protein
MFKVLPTDVVAVLFFGSLAALAWGRAPEVVFAAALLIIYWIAVVRLT